MVTETVSVQRSRLTIFQGWRGNVKARHFVLALRDYYLEKLDEEAKDVHNTDAGVDTVHSDAWAIKYIDIASLQPILESFDDDASGFITIAEMNRFTGNRPHDWRCVTCIFSISPKLTHP